MISLRPAKRQNTPLIIGLAGPSKSGKSYSALRLAVGLAGGGRIIMLNTEPHGHHYADTFTYDTADLESPHRIEKYLEAVDVVAQEKPAVLIFDTLTHLWDGIGGMKETKDEIALRMAKGDESRVDKMSAPAWAQVKAEENHFIYKLLELSCHIILCFRAKDKMAIPKKGGGEWTIIPMQPIMSDRIAFETLFTLTFPEYAHGVPDLAISAMREPFDTLIPKGRPIDEALGERLAAWARGVPVGPSPEGETSHAPVPEPAGPSRSPFDDALDQIKNVKTPAQRNALWERLKPHWGSWTGPEQKKLLEANAAAKDRVGG
jgi:hypothetical protein